MRQGKNIIQRVLSCPPVSGPLAPAHASGCTAAFDPVSYTHLDVYKRQDIEDNELIEGLTDGKVIMLSLIHICKMNGLYCLYVHLLCAMLFAIKQRLSRYNDACSSRQKERKGVAFLLELLIPPA